MGRIKRNRNARSQKGTKHRRRKPNISELVYKFLVDAGGAGRDETERAFTTKCHCCGQDKPYEEEVEDTANSPRASGKDTGYRIRKDTSRVSKSHGIKRRPTSKALPMSYLHKCVGGEDTKKTRKYIKKALDFGVESGYLIPSDPTYKVLRVSSDLMKSDSRRNKISTCDGTVSQEGNNTRDTPSRLEDLQVQEQKRRQRGRRRRGRRSRSRSQARRRRSRRRRRRRRGRRRSRSRSRSRSRRRASSPQNPEEVVEDEADDYEMDENDPKSNIHANDIEREPKTTNNTRSNPPDEERSTKKAEEDGSDLSVDEDETDDEEEKKRINTTKS